MNKQEPVTWKASYPYRLELQVYYCGQPAGVAYWFDDTRAWELHWKDSDGQHLRLSFSDLADLETMLKTKFKAVETAEPVSIHHVFFRSGEPRPAQHHDQDWWVRRISECGVYPPCGECDSNTGLRWLSVGRQQWGICENCRTAVAIGENVVSTWRYLTLEQFEQNAATLLEYGVDLTDIVEELRQKGWTPVEDPHLTLEEPSDGAI